jgi:hypothetical protein
MLRRYIALPAILLALGVTDAFAVTCKVNQDQTNFRSSPSIPHYPEPNNFICSLYGGTVISDIQPVGRSFWVRGRVDGNDCNHWGSAPGRPVPGYIAEWTPDDGWVLECQWPRGLRRR